MHDVDETWRLNVVCYRMTAPMMFTVQHSPVMPCKYDHILQ